MLHEKITNLTTKPGVYIMYSLSGAIIYVGKAKNLKNRIAQYFSGTEKHPKVSAMVKNIANFEYIVTLSERDAFALENNLIKKYKPFYNILLKDDKQPPYIRIDIKSDYPRLDVVRKIKKDGAKYFGPYISGISPYALIKAISLAFPIRQCKTKITGKQKRACLNYSLGLCSAPCVGDISKAEYRNLILKVVGFLNGNDKEIEAILTQKMQNASQTENFERALEIRDTLKMIQAIKQKVVASLSSDVPLDVFSYCTDGYFGAVCVITVRHGKILGVKNHTLHDASLSGEEALSQFIMQYYSKHYAPKTILTNENLKDFDLSLFVKTEKGLDVIVENPQKGTKHKLVKMATENATEHLSKISAKYVNSYERTIGAIEKLQAALNLKYLPSRIECYDISNISGTNKVASMVVFINGIPAKENYRKFKIRTVEGANDFKSLQETLERRLAKLENSTDVSFFQKPDLIVIDGGKGQLSTCNEVVNRLKLDIPVISLAEKFDEVFVPQNSMPIMLKRGSSELRIIQNIRDEAHRFAITFHRQLRTKQALKSPLDEISGLGKIKKQALLSRFQTIEEIKNAQIEELCMIKGINPSLAHRIFNYLNK